MPAWVIPWGLQAMSVGVKVPGDPAEVLPVDPVAGERTTDEADDRHAAVAQPAIHVLAVRPIGGRPYRAPPRPAPSACGARWPGAAGPGRMSADLHRQGVDRAPAREETP